MVFFIIRSSYTITTGGRVHEIKLTQLLQIYFKAQLRLYIINLFHTPEHI